MKFRKLTMLIWDASNRWHVDYMKMCEYNDWRNNIKASGNWWSKLDSGYPND